MNCFYPFYGLLLSLLWSDFIPFTYHQWLSQFSAKAAAQKVPKDACRIHGNMEISKVQGNFHVTPGKQINLVALGGGHAHISIFIGTDREANFSHRIHRFAFGPQVPGSLNPLDGVEVISNNSKF